MIEIFQVVYSRKNSYRFVHRITVGTVIMPNFPQVHWKRRNVEVLVAKDQEMDVLHFPLQHLVGHILPSQYRKEICFLQSWWAHL